MNGLSQALLTGHITMKHIHLRYAIPALILFIIEIIIAVFVNDRFIRPFGGDFLVVIFLYCFVLSFWRIDPWKVALGVGVFSFLIEFMQLLGFLSFMGWENSKLAILIFGIRFQAMDLLMYTLGLIVAWGLDKIFIRDLAKDKYG